MTITKEALVELLGDRPVAYHPILARVLGGVVEAVFVSQLLYWYGKGKLSENWIYKTMVEWEEETGLSRSNQQTARKNLLKLGVIEYQVRGVPGKGHYRLNIDRLVELFSLHDSDNVQTVQSRHADSDNLDCTDSANLIAETVQSIPENTRDYPETTPERGRAKKPPPAPDYLTDVLAYSQKPGQAGVADPSQDLEAFMQTADEFIATYRKRTGLWPDTNVQKPAIQALAENGADLELWDQVVIAWVKVGWNKRNVAGMIDCYERGEVPSTRKNGGKHGNRHNEKGSRVRSDSLSEQQRASLRNL